MADEQPKKGGKTGFQVESIDLKNPTPEQVKVFADLERQKGLTYSIIGGIVLLAGFVVLLLGATGQVDVSISIGDLSAEVKTAVLGVIVMLVGLVVLYIGRPDVSLQNDLTSAMKDDGTVPTRPDARPAPPASS